MKDSINANMQHPSGDTACCCVLQHTEYWLVLQNIWLCYRILDATTEHWMLLHTEYWLVEEMGLGHCEVTTRLQQTRAQTCKL